MSLTFDEQGEWVGLVVHVDHEYGNIFDGELTWVGYLVRADDVLNGFSVAGEWMEFWT